MIPTGHRVTPSGGVQARGLELPFDGGPGAPNAITDVAGVRVGYATLIEASAPWWPAADRSAPA